MRSPLFNHVIRRSEFVSKAASLWPILTTALGQRIAQPPPKFRPQCAYLWGYASFSAAFTQFKRVFPSTFVRRDR